MHEWPVAPTPTGINGSPPRHRWTTDTTQILKWNVTTYPLRFNHERKETDTTPHGRKEETGVYSTENSTNSRETSEPTPWVKKEGTRTSRVTRKWGYRRFWCHRYRIWRTVKTRFVQQSHLPTSFLLSAERRLRKSLGKTESTLITNLRKHTVVE